MDILEEGFMQFLMFFCNDEGGTTLPVEQEDYSKYLQRSTRIFSLARKHRWREKPVVMMLSLSKAAEGMTINELSSYIGKKLISKLKDQLICTEEEMDINCLLQYIRPEILSHYRFRRPTVNEARIYTGKNKCKTAELVVIEHEGENWVVNMAQATRKSSIAKGWKWRATGEVVYFHDAAMFFGWLVVISEVTSYLLSIEEKDEDVVYREIEETSRELCLILKGVICRNDELGMWLSEHYGMRIGSDGRRMSITAFPEYMMSHDVWDVGMLVDGKGFARAFCRLRLKEEQERLQDKEARRIAESYATCFMTKKNIPDKVLRAMAASKLNEHFGFVEFDEDVDLTLVKEFEKDFEALQTILRQPKKSDYEIRLRKLGRHHAAGLYFPTLHCLCVDLRMVWSTSHEYFHLLDHHYGNLSLSASFAPVYEKYCGNIDRDVIQSSCGQSKYNYEYYTMPTEVFARCGEMYLIRTLKIKNSLVKMDGGLDYVYPDNAELMECINKYFGEVFIPKYCGQED